MSFEVFYKSNSIRLDEDLYNSNVSDLGSAPIPPTVDVLLQENGSYLLQEDGSRIII
ncbi:MAG: hypothetical protein JSW00_04105 [Thermoplasmata archaeon]|jgi:hypothetical protein|nr:MAG: hypothetical protein JSW00_04105 [Thermoplasmata archaeon]